MIFRSNLSTLNIGLMMYGQEILALQGHSGRKSIDPELQDNVHIPNNFYHIGCAIKLHSITNSGLTPEGQNLRKRQTVFFTSVDPMNQGYTDPEKINLEAPRPAWYHQKKWLILHYRTMS